MKFGDIVTFSDAVFICLFSLVVVFVVLLAISFLIDIIAWLVNRGESKSKDAPAPAASEPAPAAPAKNSNEAVLIAAAVAAYLGRSPEQFVVRSYRRIPTDESAWGQVSRHESLY